VTADIWQYTFIEGRGAAVERGVIIAEEIALVAEEIVMAYDENGEEWDAEAEKEAKDREDREKREREKRESERIRRRGRQSGNPETDVGVVSGGVPGGDDEHVVDGWNVVGERGEQGK
jgi:hypothetical protein